MTNNYLERDYMSADGLRLYYRVYGAHRADRPAVICLPGLTRNCRDFARLATHLSENFHVFTPDLRGRGRSQYDLQWQRYQPLTYVADVMTLIAHEQLESVALIGTSLGGLVAMLLAATPAVTIKAIVLNDIGPEVESAALARIGAYVGNSPVAPSWDAAIARAQSVYGLAFPDFTAADWRYLTECTCREADDGAIITDYDPHIGAAVRAAPSGAAPDLWPLFGMLRNIPTLAIRGGLSDVLSVATFARMRAAKPDLQQLEIANRGHAPTLDEAAAVAAIDQLLRG